MITIKNHGFEFVDFIRINENYINDFHPIAGSFAVVVCEGKFLICYNNWREQWELPAGKREGVETAKDCAKRELFEEAGQVVENLEFIGLMKVKKSADGSMKFNPVYLTVVEKLQPFQENEETSDMKLWNFDEEIIEIDEVDLKLLEYLKGSIRIGG